MSQAIRTALEFPDAYQRPLLEELGWRSTAHSDPAAITQHEYFLAIPTESQCVFMRGAVRGWTLRRTLGSPSDWNSLLTSVQSLDAQCSDEVDMGLSWALVDRFPTKDSFEDANHQLQQANPPPSLLRRLKRLRNTRNSVNVWETPLP